MESPLLNKIVFLSVYSLGVTVFAKYIYDALNHSRRKASGASDANFPDGHSKPNDATVSSVVTGSDVVDTSASMLISEDTSLQGEIHSSIILEDERPTWDLGEMFAPEPRLELARISHNSWFRAVQDADNQIFLVIFLNKESGLSADEMNQYVRSTNYHAQSKMRRGDAELLNAWIAMGKPFVVFKVSNESELRSLHRTAKQHHLQSIKMMNKDKQRPALLGLGPATVRELDTVLGSSVHEK